MDAPYTKFIVSLLCCSIVSCLFRILDLLLNSCLNKVYVCTCMYVCMHHSFGIHFAAITWNIINDTVLFGMCFLSTARISRNSVVVLELDFGQ